MQEKVTERDFSQSVYPTTSSYHKDIELGTEVGWQYHNSLYQIKKNTVWERYNEKGILTTLSPMQVTKLRCYLHWQKYDNLIADIRSNRSSLIFSFPVERLNKGEINAIYIPQSVFSLLFLKRLKLKSTNSQNHLNLVKPRFFFFCMYRKV